MRCRLCNTNNTTDSDYCSQCGARLKTLKPSAPMGEKLILIIALVLVLGSALAYMLQKPSGKPDEETANEIITDQSAPNSGAQEEKKFHQTTGTDTLSSSPTLTHSQFGDTAAENSKKIPPRFKAHTFQKT